MKPARILLSLVIVVFLMRCATGISKKDKGSIEIQTAAVLSEALANDDYILRNQAVKAMGRSDDVSFVPLLIESLYDPEDLVVMQAARALGALGDTTAIPDLESVLANDPNFTSRKAAAVALYRLGKKQEALDFINNAYKDGSSFNRSMIINETTFARSDEFIPMYIEMLKDSVGSVRNDAIDALSIREAKEAVPFLMEVLTDSFLVIRANALIAISQVGDTTQIREAMQITKNEIDAFDEGNLDNVIQFQEYHFDIYKLLYAGTLLTELHDTTALSYLHNGTTAPDNYSRMLSTILLADWGDEEALETVKKIHNDNDFTTREVAVDIIGETDKDWACEYLIVAANDTDDGVRKTAVQSLKYYNTNPVKEILISKLKDENPKIIVESARSLNVLEYKDSYPILLDIMNNDQDWYTRIEAAEVLYEIINTQ